MGVSERVDHRGIYKLPHKIIQELREEVDTLVKQLRRKIAPYGSYIRSVYGVGYIFEGEENETAEA